MRLFLALLLLPSLVFGGGEIVRQGSTVILRADCLAFNLDTFNKNIPEGVTTLTQLVLIAASSQRDLTPEEIALCKGIEVHVKAWRVHDNGNLTRPAYTLAAGVLIKSSERATIGELCGDFALPVANTTKREYRYLVSNPQLVAICEFQ